MKAYRQQAIEALQEEIKELVLHRANAAAEVERLERELQGAQGLAFGYQNEIDQAGQALTLLRMPSGESANDPIA